jgi:hypothetical protein
MESGTGQAKSSNAFEGLNEEQVKFLNYVAGQLKGKDTAGLSLEVSTLCWRWDANRGMWVRC